LDGKERILLSYFRQNARQALTRISKRTGIPVSTIFDKLRKYEQGVITRHTALLDFGKLGYSTRANVFVKTHPDNRPSLGKHLQCHPNVNNVYRVNNGFDFLVDCVFRTVQDLEAFMENLELQRGVIGKEVFFVIEEVARERFLAEPGLVD